MERGSRGGLHAHHIGQAFDGGRDPGHQSPAAHGHQHGVHAFQLFQQFRTDGAGTCGDFRLVVGVAVHGSGFGGIGDGGVVGDGIFGAALDDGGPGFLELLHLHGGGGLGDKDGGRHPGPGRGVSVGEAGIAAGGHHDAHVLLQLAPLAAGKHAVERTPGLERSGVLHELALQPDVPGKASLVRFDDGCAAHQPGNPGSSFIDVSACDHFIPGWRC